MYRFALQKGTYYNAKGRLLEKKAYPLYTNYIPQKTFKKTHHSSHLRINICISTHYNVMS